MNKDEVREKIEKLEEVKNRVFAQFNQIVGAISVLKELLEEDKKDNGGKTNT